MSTRLEYEGRFLADIEDFGIFQSKTSQAVAIDIFFNTLTYFQGDAQSEYSGYRTRGRFFVIGKVGERAAARSFNAFTAIPHCDSVIHVYYWVSPAMRVSMPSRPFRIATRQHVSITGLT